MEHRAIAPEQAFTDRAVRCREAMREQRLKQAAAADSKAAAVVIGPGAIGMWAMRPMRIRRVGAMIPSPVHYETEPFSPQLVTT